MTFKLASYSPYFSFANNPISFFDFDGAFPYTFHVRAFAPPGAFKGTGFHDDNRGFSTSTSVTSRIKQAFTIDPTKQSISGGTPTSDPTVWNGISKTAENEGGYTGLSFGTNSLGSSTASLNTNFSGSNPFFYGTAPNIDVSSAISITENLKTKQVIVSLDLSSKNFPATESIVKDNAGNVVFLAGAAAHGTAGDLISNDKKLVTQVDLTINIDDKGVFQSVLFQGKTYTLDEWNKASTKKEAGPISSAENEN